VQIGKRGETVYLQTNNSIGGMMG